MMDSLPLLSLMFLTLPLGAALAWLLPRPESARVIALGTAVVDLVVAIAAVVAFDPAQPGFQLVEKYPWIPSLNIHYMVGIDGISLLFLPAAILLFIGVILASWNSVHTLPRLYYSLLMLLETATLGVFCALDSVLFFLFWEFTLVPLYFLISLWGVGANRRHAAMKYTLVMLAGGVPLLFGFLVLAFGAAAGGGPLVFDLPTLLRVPLPSDLQYLVFLLLLVGFGVKVPVFPLHTWLPLIAIEGPAAVAALLTGMKLGAYGLIRFAVPLAPTAAQELHWLLAGLGVLAILYGAAAALAQTNLRRMLAYASLSHVGLVVLGIASFNLQGLQGAVLQLLNFTLAAGGLFLLASHLHHRTGSTDIASLGGVARTMPWLSSFFLLYGLAGMGLPGTSGFPAELLILMSTFKDHAGAGLAALVGMVASAVYFLAIYRRAFLGPATRPAVLTAEDLRPRELWLALTFALLIILFGFFPAPLLDLIRPAAEAWLARLG
ncbi:MAG: NADH-quinone oxidoreductase subunit M [Gammaproteobacteria bacterium]|nr:NADH-quinone oxidoreductase subunit M [Gammaproteobacteria bacterium]MBU1646010.1 NADH-quinone oxidoreductase subunit M [Gammaproteobacteria bacterium]MBU1972072.1 NADH-quinone oxidoreductase subunit M [Gammaproteobacteria bacterium]